MKKRHFSPSPLSGAHRRRKNMTKAGCSSFLRGNIIPSVLLALILALSAAAAAAALPMGALEVCAAETEEGASEAMWSETYFRASDTSGELTPEEQKSLDQTCLEFSFLTLKHILKVLSQRHAVEGTHEQRLGFVLGIGHHSVRTLQHHAEQTALQHEGFYITLHFKLVRRLLAVSLHADAEQLAAVTSFNLRDDTAHRRNKFHFRMQLVHKQGIPDLDVIALFHDRLGLYSAKIIGTERILLRHLHGQSFQSGSALELNVKTFAQLDYFCHYVLLNKYGFAPQKY